MISTLSKQGGRRVQMGNTSPIFVGRFISVGTTEAEIPVPEINIREGFGNWYGKDKKTRIRFVQKLTKELKQIEKKIDAVQAKPLLEKKKYETELEIYEKLIYADLIRAFDAEVRETISALDRAKTEKVLLGIQAKIIAKQAKDAQLSEEQDIIFAIVTLME